MLPFVLAATGAVAFYVAAGMLITAAVSEIRYPPSRRLYLVLSCLCMVGGFILLLYSYALYPAR